MRLLFLITSVECGLHTVIPVWANQSQGDEATRAFEKENEITATNSALPDFLIGTILATTTFVLVISLESWG
jgi:hypothetical protein